MKKAEEIKTTDNSRVHRLLERNYKIPCPYCPLHRGCNMVGDNWRNNNWKRYRKTQWREVANAV